MTKDNAIKFLKKVNKDNNLRNQVAELYRKNPKEISQLAAKCGYPCSYEELRKVFEQEGMHGGPLSNRELEKITGGKTTYNDQGPPK